jgi:hypothetical protein
MKLAASIRERLAVADALLAGAVEAGRSEHAAIRAPVARTVHTIIDDRIGDSV